MTHLPPALRAALVADLRSRHPSCHSIVLYGSLARGDATPHSDIDVLCALTEGEASSDTRPWRGRDLDAWLYPSATMKPDDFLHLADGEILWSTSDWVEPFLAQVREALQRGPIPLAAAEKNTRRQWFEKMIRRVQRGDVEAHYRYHWMLTDLLPTYFALQDRWYLGSKQALRWLQEHEPPVHSLFAALYDPSCLLETGCSLVAQILQHLPNSQP